MTPWHDGRLVAFDLETTGTDPETARIVSAAIAVCGGGEPTETRTWLADPGIPIPDEAAAVHGITTERAQAEGRPAGEVIDEILCTLAERPAYGPVVVFNARYDLTVLDREARRHGFDPEEWVPGPVVDPLVIDKHLDRYRRGSRKLADACHHYAHFVAAGDGARNLLTMAHDAGDDALAAARLAWIVGKHGEIIRRVRNVEDGREKALLQAEWEAVRHDLPALHTAQVRWAAEQAEGLEAYFAAKGEPQAVAREWPLIPFRGTAA